MKQSAIFSTDQSISSPPGELEQFGARLVKAASYTLAVCVPFLVTQAYLNLTVGGSLFDPMFARSDELAVWRSISIFREQGFSHLGSQDRAFIVMMGLLASFVDWTPGAMIAFNFGFLAFATALFLFVVRPSPARACLAGAVIASSVGVPINALFALQESFHQAVGIVAGTALCALAASRERTDPLWKGLLMGGVIAAGLVRPLWFTMLAPMIVLWSGDTTFRWKDWPRMRALGIEPREGAAHLMNFGCVAIVLLASTGEADHLGYRMMLPHLLCAAIFLLGMNRMAPVLLLVLSNLVTIPSAVRLFEELHMCRYADSSPSATTPSPDCEPSKTTRPFTSWASAERDIRP